MYIFMLHLCVVLKLLYPLWRLLLLSVRHIFRQILKKTGFSLRCATRTNSILLNFPVFISRLFDCKQVYLYATVIDAFSSLQSPVMILSNSFSIEFHSHWQYVIKSIYHQSIYSFSISFFALIISTSLLEFISLIMNWV